MTPAQVEASDAPGARRFAASRDSPPAVTFGLAFPWRAGTERVRRAPGRVGAELGVLLLPVVPAAAGMVGLTRAGAGRALVGFRAGAPDDAVGAVVTRPDAGGVGQLIGLAALLVVALALVVAAGLVAGAASRGRDGRGTSAVRLWSVVAPATVMVGLTLAVAAGVVVALAVLAGRVRFPLRTVVLVLGLAPLALGALRLSLAPALAAAHDLGPRAAVARAWTATRGESARLALAAVGLAAGVGGATVVVAWLGGAALRTADAQGLASVSPLAPGLWTAALLPVAVLAAATLWGHGLRAVAVDVGPGG